MGKNFDALVDFAKKHCSKEDKAKKLKGGLPTKLEQLGVQGYLEDIIKRCHLFEIDILGNHIRREMEQSRDDFDAHIKEYFDFSENQGTFFLTPFRATAIEDSESVVILDNIEANEYHVTACRLAKNKGRSCIELVCGFARIVPLQDKIGFRVMSTDQYHAKVFAENGKIQEVQAALEAITGSQMEIGKAAVAYIAQAVYIMDPENFILKKESNMSIRDRQRAEKRRKPNLYWGSLRKTAARHHYVCVGGDDLRDFLLGTAKHPFPAHPVKGHWRRFRHPKYTNVKGLKTMIDQYFKGEGHVIAREGWNYTVMVKMTSPARVLTYSQAQALKEPKPKIYLPDEATGNPQQQV